jgi:membrane protein
MSRLTRLLVGAAAGVATSTYIARTALRDERDDAGLPLRAPERPIEPVPSAKLANAIASPAVAAPGTTPAAAAAHGVPNLKSLMNVAIAAAKDWSNRRAASKGAALALYTLLSMAPMLVLVLTFVAFFVDRDTAQRVLVDQLGSLVGDQGAAVVKGILSAQGDEKKGFFAGLISFAVVLVGATTAFGELKDSLDELWEVKAEAGSGIWHMLRERFLSLGLLLVLGLMLLSSLVVSAGLAAVTGGFGDTLGTLLGKIAAGLVTFAVLMVLFSVIFKYLPAVKLAWRDVFTGAVVTSVLFMVGKTAIGLYLAHGGTSDAFGAAGSLVALIVWMYYSAQIFFYGALFTHDYATTIGSRQGDPAAAQPGKEPPQTAVAGAHGR